MDDMTLLHRPLHGRGHQSATLSQVFRHAKDTQSRSLLKRGHSAQNKKKKRESARCQRQEKYEGRVSL